jgi:hypothetical protein
MDSQLLFPTRSLPTSQSQCQSHTATYGQSISKSWCRAPSGAHDQILITLWQLRSFLWGALSDERSQSHIATDGQPVSKSWCRAPGWQLRSCFCGAPTLTRGDERAEQSRSLVPATSRHAQSWHRAPLGPMAIYLFNVKTFVLFSLSLILLIDKGGVGLLYIYRMVFTYYTLRHLRLLFPPLRVLEYCI